MGTTKTATLLSRPMLQWSKRGSDNTSKQVQTPEIFPTPSTNGLICPCAPYYNDQKVLAVGGKKSQPAVDTAYRYYGGP